MWRSLSQREIGAIRPVRVANQIIAERSRSLELLEHKEIVSAHKGGINSLQIDETEWRYLLAGSSDGSVGVYDTLQFSRYDVASNTRQHEALFVVDKSANRGHKFVVSSVHWYPVDTGLFVSGSFDRRINVWDTNTLQVATQFELDGKVYAVSMSPIAATHMLIAAGTEDPNVRLCDIASGAFTHTLSGHRDGVWAVQWSFSSEWVLTTGGCDGAIRFWDIRRAGSYQVLDQNNSQIGRRPPVLKKSPQQSRRTLIRDPGVRRQQLSGFASSNDHATAHYGIVTALTPTADGYFLLSAGTDSRVRLWDIESGCNTLVNYESARIPGYKGMELALSSDSSLLFVPSSTVIRAYDLWTGHLHKTLRGHYDNVNCCAFHPRDQELYSGSNDRKILVWGCSAPALEDEMELGHHAPLGALPDDDAWSD